MGKDDLTILSEMLISILIVAVISGCTSRVDKTNEKSDRDIAISKCSQICKSLLSNKTNLSNGPCISNEIINDWVCDIAHNPRIPIDNNPENQCSAYREKKAHHFVELTETCEFIRAI